VYTGISFSHRHSHDRISFDSFGIHPYPFALTILSHQKDIPNANAETRNPSVKYDDTPETDIASLHISKPSTDETANAIPLDGKVTVWRIENFEKVLVKPENVGHFYSGDSYIVLYSYKKRREDGTVKSNEEHIIYFWHGNDSSQDEKGSSAILATMLDDELGGTPIQVMVAQGKEPRHFRALFHGALVVHFGGVASGFKNVDDEGK